MGSNTANPESVANAYRRVWHHRPFLLLWGGSAASTLGDQFFVVAVMWYVYAASRSSLKVALVDVAFQGSLMLIGPIAGVFADRWDRRRTMAVSDAIRTVIMVALAVVTWRMGLPLFVALAAVICIEGVGRFFGPARSAFIPQMIPPDDLNTANGLMSGTRQAMGTAGQALAGILVSFAGATAALLVDGASFFVSFAAVALIRAPRAASIATKRERGGDGASNGGRGGWVRFGSEMREGWDAVAHNHVLRALTIFSVGMNAFFAMYGPVLPAYASHQLHTGAWGFGAVQSVQFAGGFVGGLLAGVVGQRIRAGVLFIGEMAVLGLVMIALGLLHVIPVVLLLWGMVGFLVALVGVIHQSLTQILVPQRQLARAFTVMSAASMILMPLGSLVGGDIANHLGPSNVLLIAGLAFVAMTLMMIPNRSLRTAQAGPIPERLPSG